ncbi:hypothetical protein AM1H77_12700 [Apilactobacillus micheneri]
MQQNLAFFSKLRYTLSTHTYLGGFKMMFFVYLILFVIILFLVSTFTTIWILHRQNKKRK